MRKLIALLVPLLICFSVSAQPPVETRPSKYYGSVEFDNGQTIESGEVVAYADNREQGRSQFSDGNYELVVERNSSSEEYTSVSFVVFVDGTEVSTGQTAEFREFESQEVNLTVSKPQQEQEQDDSGGSSGGGGGGFPSLTQSNNEPPVAGFTWDTPVRPGEETMLYASGSFDPDGTVESYRWSIGARGSQVSNVFDSAGSYPVTLTVEDDDGAEVNVTKDVRVTENSPPVPSFEVVYSGSNILTDVSFNASDSYDPDGEIREYSWSFGEEGDTAVASFQESRNVTLTVVDNEGETASVTKALNQPVDDEEGSQTNSITGQFTGSESTLMVVSMLLLAAGAIYVFRNKRLVSRLKSFYG